MSTRQMIGTPYVGKRVDVQVGNHVVITDQNIESGGEDLAPSMGGTFLAGLVACTTSTARGYCKEHGLPWPEKVIATIDMDDATELVTKVHFQFVVPEDFPKNRLSALKRAAEKCTVTNWWKNPPVFELETTISQD